MSTGGGRVTLFVSSSDVLVSFPGKRRDISDKLKVHKKTYNSNAANLQVGNWTIRLNRVKIDYQNYNFYVSTGNANEFIRIDCDDLSSWERNELQTIFKTYTTGAAATTVTTYNAQSARNQKSTELRSSAVIADVLCRGAEALSGLMVSAAESKAGQIDKQTEELKEDPVDSYDYHPVQVLPQDKEYVKNARFVTGIAASITSGLVYGACSAISFLGTTCGPTLKAGAAKALTGLEIQKNEHDARNTVEDFCNVAGGVLSSVGHILKGVEESAKIIGPSAMKYAGERVGRQYGQDMGEVTEDLLGTVGNLATVGYNAKFCKKQVMLKGVPDAKLEENPVEMLEKQMSEGRRWRPL